MKHILIIQTAFLGDVILATPVLDELKRIYPAASIDFLLKKGNESLLANHVNVNEIIVFDKSKGKWSAILRILSQCREKNYDLVINLHRFGSSGIIAGFSKGKKRYGFGKNPFSFLYTKKFDHTIGDGTHEVERNLSIIREFGAKKSARPSLYPSKLDREKVEHLLVDRYFCIAPASVWFTKQLPKEKWIELLTLMDNEATVYLLGGKEDFALCEEIKNAIHSPRIFNLAGTLSLLQSAVLMQHAKRSFVNDSGPLHLASAVNAPVTVFFCSTVPDFGFGPLSEDAKIGEVKGLTCRPCGLHGHSACPEGHFDCGYKMDVSSIR